MHSWHLYVIRLAESKKRDDLIGQLAKQKIGTSVHFIPLHHHPYWQLQGSYSPHHEFPVATREFDRVVSIAIYSKMSDDDVSRVINAVLAAIE